MEFNYNDPIDITAVNTAVKKHGKTLDAIPRLGADAILKHMTPLQGITDSYTFTKVVLKTVSSKYTGEFKGLKNIGKFVPRTLTVHPIVIEVLDEPERYRRSYVTEVRGAIEIAKHPFEMWLVQEILKQASNDLLGALATAKYDADEAKTAIIDAFDSIPSIVEAEKTAGNISVANDNMVATAAFTRANIGDELLKMWRSRNDIFRRMKSKLFISDTLGDLYDDWFADEHPGIHDVGKTADETGQQFLYGSHGNCEIVRVPNLPEGSQFVMLTVQENVFYGFDKMSDMRTIKAVPHDYKFKALGKYVFGTQIGYIGPELFVVNDKPVTPATQSAGETTGNETTGGEEETYTYTEVTPVGTENPSTEGWYVKNQSDEYELTTDTTVQQGTTYYERS